MPLRDRLSSTVLLGSLVALSACQTGGPRVTGPVCAIWVTRFDYRTAADVRTVMANCHDAGFNTVMFQVRGNGTAFYRSRLEPWAAELGGGDPGFDPLLLACEECHDRGMDLHAWINVMPSWRGAEPPADPDQLYNRHPEWHWYDQHGRRQPLVDGFYVSLNPCLPEVRRYLVGVCEEIVTGYDVDGLHLDYIRFVDDLVQGDSDYPRDALTLTTYRVETGRRPEQDARAWAEWRAAKVTALVRAIGDMIEAARPEVVLSAAVGSSPEGPTGRHFRDSAGWARGALVDAVFPMNYTNDVTLFSERTAAWRRLSLGARVVTGINLRPDDRSFDVTRAQLLDSLANTPHFCLFAYSYLFGAAASAPEEAARRRLREELLPFLRALAADQPPMP